MMFPLSALAGDAIGRLPAPRQRPVTVAAIALFGLLLPCLGRLRRSGITTVVVSDAYQRQELLGAGGYRPVDRHGDVTTFAVEPEPDAPDVGQLLQPDGDLPRPIGSRLMARVARVRPEELRWSTDAARPVAVVAPVAYDPGWVLIVDGRDRPTRRSNDGLVRFALPAGTHRVRLRFTGSRNQPVGLALTVGGLVGAGWVLRPRHRLAHGRRRQPVSPGRRHPRSTGRGGRRGDRPARPG